MNIRDLSTNYLVKKLNEVNVNEILDLMKGNPMYFKFCPPYATRESIIEDIQALPPGKTHQDKYYFGIYDGDKLLAVVDLILSYPNTESCFIGFFMVDSEYQGKGLGTLLISEIVDCLYSNGYKYTRLGYVKGNPQARAFWLKNFFVETGIETNTEKYTIVVLQRDNGKARNEM